MCTLWSLFLVTFGFVNVAFAQVIAGGSAAEVLTVPGDGGAADTVNNT